MPKLPNGIPTLPDGTPILPDGTLVKEFPKNPTPEDMAKLQRLFQEKKASVALPVPSGQANNAGFQPTPLPDRIVNSPPPPFGLEQLSRQPFMPPIAGVGPPPSQVSKFARETAKKSALPMLGGMAGLGIGTIAGSPLVGEAIGAAGGEMLNQLIGITPQSKLSIATSFFLPSVTRSVVAGTKEVVKSIGRKFATPALQELGISEMERLPSILRPETPLRNLYAKVSQFSVKIPLAKTVTTAENLLQKEKNLSTGSRNQKVIRLLNGILKKYKNKQFNKLVVSDFDDIVSELQRVGARIGATKGEEKGVYSQIYKSILQDMEDLAGSGALPAEARTALQIATKATRRNFIANDLEEAINLAIKDVKQGEGFRGIDVGGLLRKIRTGKTFRNFKDAIKKGVITKEEEKEIIGTLQSLLKVPKLSSKSEGFTSGMFWKRTAVISAFLQLFAGGRTANSWLAGIVGSMGVEGAEKLIMSKAVTNMLLSEQGRPLLRRLLSDTRIIDQTKAVAIMQFLKGMFPEEQLSPGGLTQIPSQLQRQLPRLGAINQ